jgi:hypothetical protein
MLSLIGKYDEKRDVAEQLRQYLKEQMITHKILNGFVDVLVANDVYEGINSLMQTSGVGGFRPNTVKSDIEIVIIDFSGLVTKNSLNFPFRRNLNFIFYG